MGERAKRKVRAKIRRMKVWSVCVHRTPQHMYAQLRNPEGEVVTGLSTLSPEIRKLVSDGGNVAAAKLLGVHFAKLVRDKFSLERVVFDRSGMVYTGRVQAVAEGLREGNVEC